MAPSDHFDGSSSIDRVTRTGSSETAGREPPIRRVEPGSSEGLDESADDEIQSLYGDASLAIASKAEQLGWAGAAVSGVDRAQGGYVQHFAQGDIFYSAATGAHELHGEILRKYYLADPPLGLPTTDAEGTPDGLGIYNHFPNASIYWSTRTGPMIVRGAVRDRWAASGWELGPLGYPVQDQHRMNMPGQSFAVEWCRFENGLIAGDARGALPSPVALQTPAESLGLEPPPALLTYAELGELFGRRLNQQFKNSPDNVALHPGMDLTGVSSWQYGFSASSPRSVGFRFRGFHDNGLAPDTHFSIDISLRFELVWSPSATEPAQKTLVAVLDDLAVRADGGLPLADVYAGVTAGIMHAFFTTDVNVPVDPTHPEVPSAAIFVASVPTGANASGVIDLLDVLITAQGDLQILMNPLTPPSEQPGTNSWGYVRQWIAQDLLNTMQEGDR